MNFRTVLIAMFCFVLIIVGCQDTSDTKEFSKISNGLANNLEQLNAEQGITMSGFSSDFSKKILSIGLKINRDKMTDEQLKQVIKLYLKGSVSNSPEDDWEELLLPYSLIVEEIGEGEIVGILAEKLPNTKKIIWH